MTTAPAEKKVPPEAQKEHFLVAGFIMPFLDFCSGSEDHLGSTRMVLNEDGGIKEALMYQPYGTVSDVEGMRAPVPDPLREKFTGKEYDEDGDGNGASGIQAYHFGFRVYDPEVGIWNQTVQTLQREGPRKVMGCIHMVRPHKIGGLKMVGRDQN